MMGIFLRGSGLLSQNIEDGEIEITLDFYNDAFEVCIGTSNEQKGVFIGLYEEDEYWHVGDICQCNNCKEDIILVAIVLDIDLDYDTNDMYEYPNGEWGHFNGSKMCCNNDCGAHPKIHKKYNKDEVDTVFSLSQTEYEGRIKALLGK